MSREGTGGKTPGVGAEEKKDDGWGGGEDKHVDDNNVERGRREVAQLLSQVAGGVGSTGDGTGRRRER